MKKYSLEMFFILFIIASCGDHHNHFYSSYDVYNYSKLTIKDNDGSEFLISPSSIIELGDGLLIYDYNLYKYFKVNYDGNIIFSFGRKGNGPGEFSSASKQWLINDSFIIHDVSSQKFSIYDINGNFIEDRKIEFYEFSGLPTRVEALNTSEFIVPTGGRNNKLLTYIDQENGRQINFGEAAGEVYERNFEEYQSDISDGRIPKLDQNQVVIGSNDSGIFSFQQSTAVIEKYSYSFDLLWKYKLDIPIVDNLFQNLLDEYSTSENKNILPSFSYAKSIDVNTNGTAILLNTLQHQKTTIVWVPNDGVDISLVTFDNIDNQVRSFSIRNDNSYIYFVNIYSGDIYRSEWPIE